MQTIESQRVLVLGAAGMLGNAMLRSCNQRYETWGTCRSARSIQQLPKDLQSRVLPEIDVENTDTLISLLSRLQPTVIVNCVGVVKQLDAAEDPLVALPLNSIFPHRLARISNLLGARVVHISTDCVFSGSKGGYKESDKPDATDLYGRSKLLGELNDQANSITLRTSIIGHELMGSRSLLCWFLNEVGPVKGFSRAFFSGLPTNELARVVRDIVIPRADLTGLFHVASARISKHDLLKLVAQVYEKSVEIDEDPSIVIDRSLNADKFYSESGYQAAAWPDLIQEMRQFHEAKYVR